MPNPLKGKSIVVGVCGGIAAYKVVELVRLLTRAEAKVEVILTQNAARFIGPLTFEAITQNPTHLNMFEGKKSPFEHIRLGQGADLMVIAPATANMIAKIAYGIADDLLSTTVVAATCPVLLCPSMNVKMYQNPIVQGNMERLRSLGYHILYPEAGSLACGAEGKGRLPEPTEIFKELEYILSPKDLEGLKILVTAGPTREYLDPVRFISNPSSGKMGYTIACQAQKRGAEVILVSGPSNLAPPPRVRLFKVTSALEMREAVLTEAPNLHVVIKAAAVSDFRPKTFQSHKIKKESGVSLIQLVENPDILKELGELKRSHPMILVGFAAETQDLVLNAQKKLLSKNLDMIVANDISSDKAGFEVDTNQVKILYPDGAMEETPILSKEEVGHLILDRVRSLCERLLGWKQER
jgi:phosphopantothenoylcysteine decarboxylase/phosphopantothenate--cysteine ligase